MKSYTITVNGVASVSYTHLDVYKRQDLTLSGHLHGGLVRLPFIGGVVSPQVKLFPKYAQGMFEKYRRKMVVTAGLGSHSFALRINNPPEVVVLELT